ncbi:MAG: thioesterase superfamily protein [Chloroflexi bacterium]|jgi:acyl-CoA hydrolase|nr:thioesterase superfamily protein [Chloroflexota bacterium]
MNLSAWLTTRLVSFFVIQILSIGVKVTLNLPVEQTQQAETRLVHLIFPGDTNHYHTLFGGKAMSWMDQAAFICATRWCRQKVVTVHSDAIDFHNPVPEGSIVELVAKITATGRSSMTVLVEMWVEPMDQPQRYLACQGSFVLVALDAQQSPVSVPKLEPVI